MDEENRCDSCPVVQLDHAMAVIGHQIQAAQEMLVLIDTGFGIEWDSIPFDLALNCAIVKSERQKYSLENRAIDTEQ